LIVRTAVGSTDQQSRPQNIKSIPP
jgi:hypothetical protein